MQKITQLFNVKETSLYDVEHEKKNIQYVSVNKFCKYVQRKKYIYLNRI